jgi:predicted enzyme related to lactoylglutathione lyase
MKKVTGLGGIFYKVKDTESHKEWYRKNLGIESDQYGGKFIWRDDNDPSKKCLTAWSPFSSDTRYFDPGKQDFMINYRVENLDELLKELKQEGVEIVGEPELTDYGKFAWIIDPDGYKVELWEANDDPLLDE